MPKVTEYPNITSISGSSAFIYIADVSGSIPISGKISGSNLGGIISGSSTAVVATLNDLTDVNAPSPNNNDALIWNATTGSWVPAALTGGSTDILEFQIFS